MSNFEPQNPDFRVAVEEYVTRQRYLTLIGTQLARVEPGAIEYRVPFRAELGQQDGFFHGGVVGSIAEAVMGAAAYSLVAAGQNVVAASYTLNLLSPGLGETLIARGTVLKPGRRLIVCRADVFVLQEGAPEKACAAAQGAMAVV